VVAVNSNSELKLTQRER